MLKYSYLFNINIKIKISWASYNQNFAQYLPKINVAAALNFNADLMLTKWHCLDVEIQLSFQRQYKDYNFLSILTVTFFIRSSFQVSWQLLLEWTQNQSCFNFDFHGWTNIDKWHWIKTAITLSTTAMLFQYIQFSIYTNVESRLSVFRGIDSRIVDAKGKT